MNAATRKKPNRKRGKFIGLWLNEEEHGKVLQLCRLAGDPDNLSAGLRYAVHQAKVASAPAERPSTEAVQP